MDWVSGGWVSGGWVSGGWVSGGWVISKKSKGFIATTPLNIYSSLSLIVIFLFILTIRQIVRILSGIYKILLLNTNHFFT